MANLMRPAIYGAYHHITLIKESDPLVLQNLPSKRCLFNDNYAGQKGVYDIVRYIVTPLKMHNTYKIDQ